MTRVLHVVRDWVRPSEGFVADVVGHSRQPAVGYGRRWPALLPDVPSYRLGQLPDKPLRYALAAVAGRRRSQLLHAHFGYWAGHAEAVARRTGRPWVLSLHGHGPQEPQLRALLAELGAEADLVDGSVPGAVAAALQRADLVVTASRVADDGDTETLGLVNLEALAVGAPVVTTRTGGVPEAVGDAAVLVPEGDVEALRSQVQRLLDAPAGWAQIGRAGRAHVEARFDLRDRVAELEAMWDELVR